jgi:hypothetical protein
MWTYFPWSDEILAFSMLSSKQFDGSLRQDELAPIRGISQGDRTSFYAVL